MATSFDQLVRELRGFRERRTVVNACARGIRAAAKPVRQAIKRRARQTMPTAGGLNVWVSRISIRAAVKLSGRSASIKLVGGRNSQGGRSDIRAIDAGRVRAPSWGRKGVGNWHTQSVPPGFFRETAANHPSWRADVDRQVDAALDEIRG